MHHKAVFGVGRRHCRRQRLRCPRSLGCRLRHRRRLSRLAAGVNETRSGMSYELLALSWLLLLHGGQKDGIFTRLQCDERDCKSDKVKLCSIPPSPSNS